MVYKESELSQQVDDRIYNLLNERMNRGTEEMNLVKSQIQQITNNQTKISGDLAHHIQRSEEKHQQVLDNFKSFKQALVDHTDEEMDVQKENRDAIKSLVTRFEKNEFKTKILWWFLSTTGLAVGGGMMYYIHLILDKITK